MNDHVRQYKIDYYHQEIDETIVNAGGQPVTILPGGCFFDSATSFGIIRGGHVDVSVLGALQVDEKGNIANYMVPGRAAQWI